MISSFCPAPAHKSHLLATTAILLLAFLFRIVHLSGSSLWHDEKFTQIRVAGSLAHTIESTLQSGNQVPLYFLLLRAFPHINDFSMHMFSVLIGLLCVAVIILVATRLSSGFALPLWAGAILACNPFHVWYSRMARPYSLLMLLSALTSFLFIELYRGRRSRRMWLVFTALSMLTYLTHYFGLFLGLAQYLTMFLTLQQEGRFFRRWIVAQMIACLPLGVWLLAFIRSGPTELAMGWISAPSILSLPRTLWNMSVGIDSWLPAVTVPGGLAGLLLITAGVLAAFGARKAHPAAVYWMMLMIAPIVVTFLLSEIVPIYIDRYLAEIIPAFTILPILGFEWVRGRFGSRPAHALVALVCLTGAINISGILLSGQHERESWDEVVAHVRDNERSGDAFVLEQTIALDMLSHYYGAEAIIERGVLGISPGETETEIVIAPPVEPQRLWVVCLTHAIDPHRALVQERSDPFLADGWPASNWLIAHQDQIVEHWTFNGVVVILVDPALAR